MAKLISDIVHKEFVPRYWIGKDLSDLLIRLLAKDPNERLGRKDVGGV